MDKKNNTLLFDYMVLTSWKSNMVSLLYPQVLLRQIQLTTKGKYSEKSYVVADVTVWLGVQWSCLY